MRLIDAEPLYEKLMNFSVETTVSTSDTVEFRLKKIVDDVLEYYKKTISEAPTVDAVPVIRCKDCASSEDYMQNGWRYCDYFSCTMRENSFCSYGIRKDRKSK